jgi:YidC/Oxa1 family membrane protein insertase
VLHYLNLMIGNMGWAIIALTLIIKAILLPLAYKSYVSMAKMKELQPRWRRSRSAPATTGRSSRKR